MTAHTSMIPVALLFATVCLACEQKSPAPPRTQEPDAPAKTPAVAADPCADITCDPKPPACEGATAVTFGPGACADGECSYPTTRNNCAQLAIGCVEGQCSETLATGSPAALGDQHTCRLPLAGGVECWGDNKYAQLGNGEGGSIGTDSMARKPGKVSEIPNTKYTAVAAGGEVSCALAHDGGVECWGDSFTTSKSKPLHSTWKSVQGIHAGTRHACAILEDRTVQCVGFNGYGALGNDTARLDMLFAHSPVEVLGLANVSTMDSLVDHNCAVLANRSVACWGRNENGQLGDGATKNRNAFHTLDSIQDALTVEVGQNHSCVLHAGGEVSCWGDGALGQLGHGRLESSPQPVKVAGLANVVQIAAGAYHTCARTSAGEVFCWGLNRQHQLGQSDTKTNLASPTAAPLGFSASWIGAGGTHTCALDTNAALFCWGNNAFGALGDGSKASSHRPVRVLLK